MTIPDELGEELIRATVLGYKYRLALEATMDSLENGDHDTPVNRDLKDKYWDGWWEALEKSIKMLEEQELL